ncbi:MAG: ParB N-terminal domain-containing protein [Myxococcales bacterium]|nr:ParB N-terminal domain-containing protein [Myxococcales bacterium]MCB9735434.1 ParB N-terminal domain-containing protein [Deltaproteobacteria bacterium]
MGETVCGYEVHPACALLPMMPHAAIAEMAEDIQRHGQQQPVVLWEGKVLDGRNRLRACNLAGVDPVIVEWTGDDPVRWVLSLNFHRRHLTEDQRAVVGARAEQLLAERAARESARVALVDPPPGDEPGRDDPSAEEPPEDGGHHELPPVQEAAVDRAIERRARQAAAALVNVSPARIAKGRRLLDQAVPGLVDVVERGAVTMTQAARVATLAPEEQEALVALGEEAVVDEAKRLAKAKRKGKAPSMAAALAEVDGLSLGFRLEKGRDGKYVLETDGDAPARYEGADLKEVVLAAWTAIADEDGQDAPDA